MKVSTMLCAGPVSLALAEHEGAHKPGHTGVDVNDGAAGEIEHFHPCGVVPGSQEPVRAPDPVRNRRIDENRPQADEHKAWRRISCVQQTRQRSVPA